MIEDQVPHAHVAPQEDRGALGRHMAGTPVECLIQRRQGVAFRGPIDIGSPALYRVPELRPRQQRPHAGDRPVDGMDVGDDVNQVVVHDALECRSGITHVRIEERGRPRNVAFHAWHGQERRADPFRIGDDHSR